MGFTILSFLADSPDNGIWKIDGCWAAEATEDCSTRTGTGGDLDGVMIKQFMSQLLNLLFDQLLNPLLNGLLIPSQNELLNKVLNLLVIV